MRTLMRCAPVLLSLLAPAIVAASTVTIDFEGLTDGTILTTQYSGVTFSNAIILTAGISLNEFEFPPHSGTNVVSDNGGPMWISFSTPIKNFSGYFTYAEPLTINAFGPGNALLASVTSAFSNNEAFSGVPGSSSDEFLQISASAGIAYVKITADLAGGSFALDDAAISDGTSAVPEPSGLTLVAFGTLVLATGRRLL